MRHHSPILTSIWDDTHFCELPAMAQRVYFQLASQKRLTMVGVVPYQPRNWSRGAIDTTTEDIESWVAHLTEHSYVLVDPDTEELLVRTIVKHDPPRGSKSIAGMWNAWREVDSVTLKAAILRELPSHVWGHETVEPPPEAKALRNAPSDGASHTPKPKVDSPCHMPPTTIHSPPPAAAVTSRDTVQSIATAGARIFARTETDAGRGRSFGGLVKWKTDQLLKDDSDRLKGLVRRASAFEGWSGERIPLSVLAAAALGDTRSLAHYPEQAPDTEPEEPKLTREQRAALIDQEEPAA